MTPAIRAAVEAKPVAWMSKTEHWYFIHPVSYAQLSNVAKENFAPLYASLGDVQVDARAQKSAFEAWHAGKYGRAYSEWVEAKGRYAWDLTEELWTAWKAANAAMSSTPNPIQGEGEETEQPTSNVHRALPSRTARNSAKDADGVPPPATTAEMFDAAIRETYPDDAGALQTAGNGARAAKPELPNVHSAAGDRTARK